MNFITRGIYMTKAIDVCIKKGDLSHMRILQCVNRHFKNDGEECKRDKKANEYAIKNKDGRVFSVFTLNNRKIYVITDGLHLENDVEYGDQYPMTTILFAEDY